MIQETFGGAHQLCQDLLTDQRGGFVVNPDEIKERKEIYGQNSFPPPKIKTIKQLIMENFDDPINQVLLAAGMVSICIGLF